MEEIRLLAATGILGYGFQETSLEEGLKRKPDMIGCDAGSTDQGPYALGSGQSDVSRESVKRDLSLILKAAHRAKIPVLIGTAGTAGGAPNLLWTREIAEEVAQEEGIHFKMAIINSEQRKDYLLKKLSEGKIKPLTKNAPEINAELINRSIRIVGMMGAEPFIKALQEGADVVIAGRASDPSIYAALPLMKGFPPGPVWHAAKTIECGAAIAEPSGTDSIIAYVRRDHFLVEPTNPIGFVQQFLLPVIFYMKMPVPIFCGNLLELSMLLQRNTNSTMKEKYW
jgi:hypothetical protein